MKRVNRPDCAYRYIAQQSIINMHEVKYFPLLSFQNEILILKCITPHEINVTNKKYDWSTVPWAGNKSSCLSLYLMFHGIPLSRMCHY